MSETSRHKNYKSQYDSVSVNTSVSLLLFARTMRVLNLLFISMKSTETRYRDEFRHNHYRTYSTLFKLKLNLKCCEINVQKVMIVSEFIKNQFRV